MELNPWDAVTKQVTKIGDQLAILPVFREVTVVTVSPEVTVMFDTDVTAKMVRRSLASDPKIGDRGIVMKLGHTLWLIGVRGGSTVPVGVSLSWTGPADKVPDNYMIEDGRALLRAEYPALFALYGVAYGAGDGSTTFNIRDKRGRVGVAVSTDTEFDTLGKKYGTKTHTLSIAEMPSHTHPQNVTANVAPGAGIRTDYTGDASSTPYPQGIPTNPTGGGGAHNNVQPSIAEYSIVRVR